MLFQCQIGFDSVQVCVFQTRFRTTFFLIHTGGAPILNLTVNQSTMLHRLLDKKALLSLSFFSNWKLNWQPWTKMRAAHFYTHSTIRLSWKPFGLFSSIWKHMWFPYNKPVGPLQSYVFTLSIIWFDNFKNVWCWVLPYNSILVSIHFWNVQKCRTKKVCLKWHFLATSF